MNTEHWLGVDESDKLMGMAASEKISRISAFAILQTYACVSVYIALCLSLYLRFLSFPTFLMWMT